MFVLCACVLQQVGRIHAAAFSDGILHSEMVGKSLFWQQTSFYGIDMTPLLTPATEGYFAQVWRLCSFVSSAECGQHAHVMYS